MCLLLVCTHTFLVAGTTAETVVHMWSLCLGFAVEIHYLPGGCPSDGATLRTPLGSSYHRSRQGIRGFAAIDSGMPSFTTSAAAACMGTASLAVAVLVYFRIRDRSGHETNDSHHWSKEKVWSLRRKHFSKSSSVSYANTGPLMIVEVRKSFLVSPALCLSSSSPRVTEQLSLTPPELLILTPATT